jgi:broad specificity phosphatase PhoE
MHIYFVRHGVTDLNAHNIHQSPSTPLSTQGREQALSVAEYLRSVNPDLLISSEYTRALETARIIGMQTGLTPQVQGLFYELARPSSLFGKTHFHPETLLYVILSVLRRKNPKWHYKDAENFTDIQTRAGEALAYLESLRDTHTSVIVVSHTIFINCMVSYMCKNRLLDVRDLILTVLHIKRMKNTDVIHVEYIGSGAKNTCAWRVVDGV